MKNTDIEKQVIELIQQNASFQAEIDSDTNFLIQQILDSFAILSLMMQIEQKFTIKFSVEELSGDALQTVQGLSQAIKNKLN